MTYVAVGFILFLAGFTQGLSGFGSILMSLPLLAVFLDIKTVIPLTALAGQAITLMILFQLKRQLDWKKILPLVVSALPGILVGVYFLKRMDKGVIHWILGITLIVYSLYSLFLRRNKSALKKRWAYLFGFLGGCLGGAFSAAGPPVIVYTSLCAWSKDQIKITLQGFFVMSGMVVVMTHAVNGLTTLPVVRFFTAGLPLLLLGTYIGGRFSARIDEIAFRRMMMVLLAGLGVLLIVRA
jgi:uncharacterized membrane protein YfcA